MATSGSSRGAGLRTGLRISAASIPWIAALYLQYWLQSAGYWVPTTPYRGVMSVALIALGAAASLLLFARLSRRSAHVHGKADNADSASRDPASTSRRD